MRALLKNIVVAALTYEAKLLLRRAKPTVIAVTGSVGKTTTKDAIFAAIKDSVSARKSEKSFNSEIGIPLTVLGLTNAYHNPILWIKNILDGLLIALFPHEYPKVLVIEAGVDRPGDMAKLTSWLRPDIAVLTRLPDIPVHVEYFERPVEVVAEKMQLVYALTPNGTFVYNHDDPIIQSELKNVRHSAIGYSRYLPSQFTASVDRMVYEDDRLVGSECTVTYMDKSVTVRNEGVVGEQCAYANAAALAVAIQLDIDLEAAAEGLRGLTTPPGRMRVLPGIKSTTIIDDTYNSSPVANEASLNALREVQGAKRRIAVLGDMLELGRFSMREHERIGRLVAKSADVLFTVGVRSRKTAEGALEHGMSEKLVFQYDDVLRAGKELQQFLEQGDVVLVKGSQSIRAEKVVEEIMQNPVDAGKLLVRQ